jgi:beta-glucanase (GH16 family)
MRRYVTIGSIVVATVLAGSAAAYAEPGTVAVAAAAQPAPDQAGCPTTPATPPASTAPAVPAVPAVPAADPTTPVAPVTPGDPASPDIPGDLSAPAAPAAPAVPSAPSVPVAPAAPAVSVAVPAGAGPVATDPATSAPVSALRPAVTAGEPGSDEPGSDEAGSDEAGPAGDQPDRTKGDDSTPVAPKPAEPATSAPAPAATAPTPAESTPAAACGADTSAATKYGWGSPNRVDEFDNGLGLDWDVYDGEGHDGQGRRTPDAVSVKDGIMTITGNANGDTAGLAWNPGQKYGRWEGRVRAPVGDSTYNALMLLWPDAENWPVGGEVDFMEMSDDKRQSTDMFLHYGANNDQEQGSVDIDATQWHDWAVEWTPTSITAFVDGKEWWKTTKVDILPPGPMHLCIQLDWFPEGRGDVTPTRMEVAWVKQYPLNGDAAKEGVADTIGQAARTLTEGGPDPVPSVSGLVARAVAAVR